MIFLHVIKETLRKVTWNYHLWISALFFTGLHGTYHQHCKWMANVAVYVGIFCDICQWVQFHHNDSSPDPASSWWTHSSTISWWICWPGGNTHTRCMMGKSSVGCYLHNFLTSIYICLLSKKDIFILCIHV